jgi:hypothetical protein
MLEGFVRRRSPGLNRATSLAYGAVSRNAIPLDRISRSNVRRSRLPPPWTAFAGPDLKAEIEARVARLFRWHIDPTPVERSVATEVLASIFYHLLTALMQYLEKIGGQVEPFRPPVSETGKFSARRVYA